MRGIAQEYFGSDRIFPDLRLDARLLDTFNRMGQCPEGTLPQKLSSRAELVGGYRLFNNRKVEPAAMLDAHRQQCLKRLENYRGRVLNLHDQTVLDYSGLHVEGLGQVGNGHGQGLYAHNSLLVIPQTREVVGLMGQILHRRDRVPKKETRQARQARQSRESRLWKQAVEDLPPMPPGVQVTDVTDRGSDVMEYIWYEVSGGREFIVRSQHNRILADGRKDPGKVDPSVRKLHDRLRALGSMGRYTLRVAAPGGGWREAKISVAFAAVSILPPRQARGEHGQEPMNLWGLIAWEELSAEAAAAGVEPIEWILLTNRPVETIEQAREVVEDYACRWMIEEYHKAQKSGCGIEELQMTTRHGLDNAITVLSVLAVHVLRLRCYARDESLRDQPARLHEEELKVQLAARASKHRDWREMTVWEYSIAVAHLGGYMLNPRKRPPGWQILWRGYIRLESMCAGVRLVQDKCVQT
jgi:hypothetical protein